MKCFQRIVAFFVCLLLLSPLFGSLPSSLAVSVPQKVSEEEEKTFISLEFLELCVGFKRGFRFYYQGAPGCVDDFIAMYRVEGEERHMVHQKPLNRMNSDFQTMDLPSLPGVYELSLRTNNGAIERARSHQFRVIWRPSDLSVLLLPPDKEGKRKFLLAYCGTPGFEGDRISLYRAGAGNGTDEALATKVLGPAANRGELIFEVPSEPGFYEFRLLSDQGKALVNQSLAIHSLTGETLPPAQSEERSAIEYPPLWLRADDGNGKVYLEWTPPEPTLALKSYRLYRRTREEAEYTLLKELDLTEKSYLDEELQNYTIYLYQLRPVNAQGQELAGSNVAFGIPQKISFWVGLGTSLTTRMKTFTFAGQASPGSQVTVNDIEMPVLPEGYFLATIELEPGKNRLEITAMNNAGDQSTHLYWMELVPIEPLSEDNVVIVLTIGSTQAWVNGKPIELDVAPFIEQGRTLVPFRFVGESLGAEVTFTTDNSGRVDMVSYTLGDLYVVLFIGRTEALVNGEKFELEVPPKIVQGRTVIPIRFVSEALGCEVSWIAETREITIRYKA